MSGIAAAVVGSAVVGGMISAHASSKSAGAAADAATSVAETQAQVIWDMYNTSRSDMLPFLQAGVGALNELVANDNRPQVNLPGHGWVYLDEIQPDQGYFFTSADARANYYHLNSATGSLGSNIVPADGTGTGTDGTDTGGTGTGGTGTDGTGTGGTGTDGTGTGGTPAPGPKYDTMQAWITGEGLETRTIQKPFPGDPSRMENHYQINVPGHGWMDENAITDWQQYAPQTQAQASADPPKVDRPTDEKTAEPGTNPSGKTAGAVTQANDRLENYDKAALQRDLNSYWNSSDVGDKQQWNGGILERVNDKGSIWTNGQGQEFWMEPTTPIDQIAKYDPAIAQAWATKYGWFDPTTTASPGTGGTGTGGGGTGTGGGGTGTDISTPKYADIDAWLAGEGFESRVVDVPFPGDPDKTEPQTQYRIPDYGWVAESDLQDAWKNTTYYADAQSGNRYYNSVDDWIAGEGLETRTGAPNFEAMFDASGGANEYLDRLMALTFPDGVDPTGGMEKYITQLEELEFEFDPEDPIYKWRQKENERQVNQFMASRGQYDSRAAGNMLLESGMALQGEEVDRQYNQRYLTKYNQLVDLAKLSAAKGSTEYGAAVDKYGADVAKEVTGFNAAMQLGNTKYNQLLDLVKMGTGAASSTGQMAQNTGGQLANVYGAMGQSQQNALLQEGANSANMWQSIGQAPANAYMLKYLTA